MGERKEHTSADAAAERRAIAATRPFAAAAARWSETFEKRADDALRSFSPQGFTGEPFVFGSCDEACAFVSDAVGAWVEDGDGKRKRANFPLADLAELLIRNLHVTVIRDGVPEGTGLVLLYDYDERIYRPIDVQIDTYIVAALGVASNQTHYTMLRTMSASARLAHDTVEPPSHMVACGNGLYDLIRKKLLPYHPGWRVMAKMATDYNEDALELDPLLYGDMTFDSLVRDFANDNEDRVRLVEEVSKYAILRHAPNEAAVFVNGAGGDGKSLFFEHVLGGVIGARNIAFLSVDDINDDNKLIAAANAYMILGTDNRSNSHVHDDKRFKQLVTHDWMTLNRKYLSSVSMSVVATTFQLTNGLTHFSEINTALLRRLVVVEARRRFSLDGTADTQLSRLVQTREFREHTLATILAKPYHKDFSSHDMGSLKEQVMADDLFGQFDDHLESLGIYSGASDALPNSYLYAIYCDYMELANTNGKPCGIRRFTSGMKPYLKHRGYVPSESRLRPSSGAAASLFNAAAFAEVHGRHFDEVCESNATTAFYVRSDSVDERSPSDIPERCDDVCDVYEYFGVFREVYMSMSRSEREVAKRESVASAARKSASKRAPEHKSVDAPALADGDVMRMWREHDVAGLRRLRSTLSSADAADIDAMAEVERLSRGLKAVAQRIGGEDFSFLVESVDAAADAGALSESLVALADAVIAKAGSKRREKT